MPQYKFIAVACDEGKISKPTQSIRSHAIRSGLQKSAGRRRPSRARASRLAGHAPEIGEELYHSKLNVRTGILGSQTRTSIRSDKLTNQKRNLVNAQPISIIEVGFGSIDPFDSLPIPKNQEVEYLVKYCKSSFSSPWVSINNKTNTLDWIGSFHQVRPQSHHYKPYESMVSLRNTKCTNDAQHACHGCSAMASRISVSRPFYPA
jgi:hypothetical protein